METRNSRNPGALRIRQRFLRLKRAICWLLIGLAAGCGAPGEPTPPSPPIPVAIADLSAQQIGDAVQLTFTMPVKTVSGERLSDTPATEILRGALRADGSPDVKSFRAIETIPGALAGEYRVADKIQIVNRVSPDDVRATGGVLVYRVRTRASRRRASADSNTVTVRFRPVPERITAAHAAVTESAVELSWPAPMSTSTGQPLSTISEYRIYRGEIDAASAEGAGSDMAQAKWKTPLTLLASTPTTNYRDSAFDFGKTYLYSVRTVIAEEGSVVESGDSVPAVVTPRDIYPPAVPQGLLAEVIVGSPTNAPEVDLSWSINTEPDLAGYRVYRSDQADAGGQLIAPDVLLSPTYRDMSVQPGHRYWYRVTAVDRSGNESAPSARVAADVAQPSS
jgi:hypothetical protein